MAENRNNETKILLQYCIRCSTNCIQLLDIIQKSHQLCGCKACVIIWSKINIVIIQSRSYYNLIWYHLVMLVIQTLVPISKANSSRELFSPYLNSYHNNSKHPLIIVPTKLPRTENLLAEFARFSTHIHNRTVITRSHVWKLMYHTDMTLCAYVIFGVRVEDINIRRENV